MAELKELAEEFGYMDLLELFKPNNHFDSFDLPVQVRFFRHIEECPELLNLKVGDYRLGRMFVRSNDLDDRTKWLDANDGTFGDYWADQMGSFLSRNNLPVFIIYYHVDWGSQLIVLKGRYYRSSEK